jgi:hypothetical protein
LVFTGSLRLPQWPPIAHEVAAPVCSRGARREHVAVLLPDMVPIRASITCMLADGVVRTHCLHIGRCTPLQCMLKGKRSRPPFTRSPGLRASPRPRADWDDYLFCSLKDSALGHVTKRGTVDSRCNGSLRPHQSVIARGSRKCLFRGEIPEKDYRIYGRSVTAGLSSYSGVNCIWTQIVLCIAQLFGMCS